jgi:hypothetical protein
VRQLTIFTLGYEHKQICVTFITNFDTEILNQIVQGCTSSRLRGRALRDNYDLQKNH